MTTSRSDWRPAVLEWLSSVVAVVATAGVFVNWFGAHLAFFGEPVDVPASNVHAYWVLLGVLAAGVVGSMAGAGWRGAGAAWVWHLLVGTAAAAVAVLFAVTRSGPVVDDPPPPPPTSDHHAPPCYSGNDGVGCPGG